MLVMLSMNKPAF